MPREAVRLMAKLIFLPMASKIRSGTYLLHDGACWTGGMLTVPGKTLQQIADEQGETVSTRSRLRRASRTGCYWVC